MHKYIGHTEEDVQEMLNIIGVDKVEDLFKELPDEVCQRELDIPKGLSEMALMKHIKSIADENISINDLICFLGAGAYDHYIPSTVDAIISRQEFYTAYTPYQPEISQGTLQAIFEYQSMICELTGMDVANASMYDGASAAAEAVSVACSGKKKKHVLLAAGVNPEIKNVIKTYAGFSEKIVEELPHVKGLVDLEALKQKMTKDIGAVVIQYPNYFGTIEDLKTIADIVHEVKGQLIVIAEPIALGTIEAPGKLGADIVVGEGQSLGNALNFGGPYVGFFATTEKLMRKMPGRLVGETLDVEGKRAFVLTIQTREQHIRREKATSNICSNQALNALMATVYLTTMGKEGLKEVGNLCIQKSHYMYNELLNLGCFEPVCEGPFVKEFLVKYRGDSEALEMFLTENGILFGLRIEKDFPEYKDCFLLAVTEKRTKQEMDLVVELLGKYQTMMGVAM